jgi:3-oxoacyl-[acyl-carrier protein] reductase
MITRKDGDLSNRLGSASCGNRREPLGQIEQGGERVAAFMQKVKDDTMLKELPSMADIANAAVFPSSRMASKITGVTVDVTSGTTAALNSRVAPIAFLRH